MAADGSKELGGKNDGAWPAGAGEPTLLAAAPAAGALALPGAAAPARGARAGRALDRSVDFRVPWLSRFPVNTQVQVLLIVMALCALAVVGLIALDARFAGNNARQSLLVSDTRLDTTRLAAAAPYAVAGAASAFKTMIDNRDDVASYMNALAQGDAALGVDAVSAALLPQLQKASDTWRTVEAAASTIIAQQKPLTGFGQVTKRINDETPRLQQLTEEISALMLQRSAGAREIAAAGQLVMLTQRLGRSANSLTSGEGANAEVALTLGRDINLFRDLTLTLLNGNEALRIPAATDAETRTRLTELAKVYGEFQSSIAGTLSSLQAIVQAKDAEFIIRRQIGTLGEQLQAVQDGLTAERGQRTINFGLMAFFGAALLLAAGGIAVTLLRDSRQRAAEAERQRVEAQRLEEVAKASNEQNQAAILRLMNELQEVADGDLTVQATVTEDITGAIADSINYTVEELRGLVGRINVAAEQVDSASSQARDIAARLLAASEAQSAELRATGEQVLRMAAQIDEVSRRAGESVQVARSSLATAQRGRGAVTDQIAGMNDIREQIQDTAKRIKRLGESSQQIGEIVELIGDITEQTNVLALNAAIQAAAAGEAGRGFSVVAEEVQRLADRSADAAKQIAALVRTIQTDTQDAVAAMEKSTRGVVEGAQLSDAAGSALADISQVSSQLATLIETIAATTQQQAASAGGVAQSMERILSVTEQTSVGTQETAQSIGQLATLARELKASVARFRVA
jgi:twitching motility protein PilJ